MEASQVPFFNRHVPKNTLLILLSLICLPITATLVFFSYVFRHHSVKESTKLQIDDSSRKTILVTGVSMTKGLTIARLLAKQTPHNIIAADTELVYLTSPGRYSRSITKFHRLSTPHNGNTDPYTKSLLSVLKAENVDLWISCSSVVGAIEDGEVMKIARKTLKKDLKAVQFNDDVVAKLHEKDTLMEYIRDLGLPVSESHRCTSILEVENILLAATIQNDASKGSKRFILKPIGVEDKARAQMMTLLPFSGDEISKTTSYLSSLNISASNPFILQRFISGPEYCTHSLVVHGKVKAFVSCPSSDMLMHYEALPEDSAINRRMFKFTQRVAQHEGDSFSGHLSFDFIVEGEGEDAKMYPIECNPRAHTAVVLLQDTKRMADAYLSCFEPPSSEQPLVTPTLTCGYYWIGHDLIALLIAPSLSLICGQGSLEEAIEGVRTFWRHLTSWRDGTFEIWDPWPFFVLYHIYWPLRFCESLVRGQSWSRINVSTTKMFES